MGEFLNTDEGEAQRKKEQDEWIALHERLNERRIKSGIPPAEDATFPKAGEPQKANSQENISLPTNPPTVWESGASRSRFASLTEETIRKTTQKGETPLHRAAKLGKICEIPQHLLTTELFMARNNSFGGATPIHLAAEHGHLDQVPKEFLTKETLTASTEYQNKESKTGPMPPRTETPLHIAARCGHGDQIPKEFLTPEFLSIEATGYRLTVLHDLAYSNRLDLVPDIYVNSEMWNLRNSQGQTPRDVIEDKKQREIYVAKVRSEPATEKQKEKLRWFDYDVKAVMTKGEASDAIDEYVRKFPQKNAEYYDRSATEEQLTVVRDINALCDPDEPYYDFEEEGPLTHGKAKDLFQDWEMWKRGQVENSDLTDCADSHWEKHHWDDNYENSERGQFNDVCYDILDSWQFQKFGNLPKRKQIRRAWKLVKSRKLNKSEMPNHAELLNAFLELWPKRKLKFE